MIPQKTLLLEVIFTQLLIIRILPICVNTQKNHFMSFITLKNTLKIEKLDVTKPDKRVNTHYELETDVD